MQNAFEGHNQKQISQVWTSAFLISMSDITCSQMASTKGREVLTVLLLERDTDFVRPWFNSLTVSLPADWAFPGFSVLTI